jgi:hypothetical protein
MRVFRAISVGRFTVTVTDAHLDRFRAKLVFRPEGDCILWGGSTNGKGYGCFGIDGVTIRAHRFSYLLSGELTADKQIDHLCRNRACVNPVHLEPVTPRENTLRSPIAIAAVHAAKTHCPKGHPYAGDNLSVRKVRGRWGRYCRACDRVRCAANKAKARLQRSVLASASEGVAPVPALTETEQQA